MSKFLNDAANADNTHNNRAMTTAKLKIGKVIPKLPLLPLLILSSAITLMLTITLLYIHL